MVYNIVTKKYKENDENSEILTNTIFTKSSSSSATSRSASLLNSYYKSKPLLRNTTSFLKPSLINIKNNEYNNSNNNNSNNLRNSRLLEIPSQGSITTNKNKKPKVRANGQNNSIDSVPSNIPSKRKILNETTNITALSVYTTFKTITDNKPSTKEQQQDVMYDKKSKFIMKNSPIVDQDQRLEKDHHQVINNACQAIDNNKQKINKDELNDIYDELSRMKTAQQNISDVAKMTYDQLDISEIDYTLKRENPSMNNDNLISSLQTNESNMMENINDNNNNNNTYSTIPSFNTILETTKGLPAIHLLSDDCLYEIFKCFTTTADFCVLASVCQRWNSILTDPYLWRQIDYTWEQFIHQHDLINNYFQQYKKYPVQLQYIRKIFIENEYQLAKLDYIPTISPFQALRDLHLSYIYLDDIMDLILTTVNIETLQCKHIMTRPPAESIMLSAFTNLKKLKVLELSFNNTCEHINSASLASERRPQHRRHTLSSKLKILNFTNICDIEQSLFNRIHFNDHKKNEMISLLLLSTTSFSSPSFSSIPLLPGPIQRLIQSWNSLEVTLLRKYQLFSTLSHLNELALGFCRGFTARIWRECIQPCTPSLKKLTLYGWDNDGCLENPKVWLERKWLSVMLGGQVETYVEEVEKALAETIEGLDSIEYLSFNQFQCGYGLIKGLQALLKSKSLRIQRIIFMDDPKNNNNNNSLHPDDVSIEHLDQLLNVFIENIDILVTDK